MNDNYLITLLVSGSIVVTLFAFYLTIFMVIQKSKNRRYQMERKELEYRFENELLQARLEVQEQALNQISQEIHDNIGQALSVAKANLNFLNGDPKKSEDLIESSKNIISKALADLRNVSHVLNSEYINRIGLEDSIKKEIDYLRSANSIKFELDANGEPDSLSNEKELMVFRIAQEALANIIKHGQATMVKINLAYRAGDFEMCVYDNGIGFDPVQLEKNKKGIGIINMKQRAKLMNGSLSIQSVNSGGTLIKLNLPL